jgi:hypothetical protein
MFKQVKSVFFWSLLYKFRKRLTIVFLLLSVVLLSQWIYSDIVEYLTLTDKAQYLDFVLPIKWLVVFFNISLSIYLILSLFKAKNKCELKDKEIIVSKPSLSNREKEFMTKDIRTQAQIIMEKELQKAEAQK